MDHQVDAVALLGRILRLLDEEGDRDSYLADDQTRREVVAEIASVIEKAENRFLTKSGGTVVWSDHIAIATLIQSISTWLPTRGERCATNRDLVKRSPP